MTTRLFMVLHKGQEDIWMQTGQRFLGTMSDLLCDSQNIVLTCSLDFPCGSPVKKMVGKYSGVPCFVIISQHMCLQLLEYRSSALAQMLSFVIALVFGFRK